MIFPTSINDKNIFTKEVIETSIENLGQCQCSFISKTIYNIIIIKNKYNELISYGDLIGKVRFVNINIDCVFIKDEITGMYESVENIKNDMVEIDGVYGLIVDLDDRLNYELPEIKVI